MGIPLGYSDRFLFSYDEGIILSSAVGEVLGYIIGLYEGSDMGSSDVPMMVSMMSHLRVNGLRTHLDHTM